MKTAKDGDERLMKNPQHVGQTRESLLIRQVTIPTAPSGGEKGGTRCCFSWAPSEPSSGAFGYRI